MKKHFKKRLAAFKVGLVLSIMITPFCFYKLSDTVQAAGNVITYNNYGSTERGVVNVAYNGTTYMTDSFIRFNFNGNYNGVLGINLSGASPMSALAVVPDNCHIISTATNYIQIEFYGVNQCEVHFTGWQAVVGNFDIQSVIWNSMTKVSDSNAAQLVNIRNRLDTLNGYTDQIESLLTTNNTLLQTIANNGGSGGSSTVNNIDINVDHIADELSLLKTSNDSILDELLGFFTDGLGQILTIENVVNAIEDTTTALLGIQNQLTGIGTTLTSINTTLNSINQNINNINTLTDNIDWKTAINDGSFEYLGYTTDFTNFSKVSGNVINNGYFVFRNNGYNISRTNTLNKITLDVVDTMNYDNNLPIRVYYVSGSNNNLTQIPLLYSNCTRFKKEFYYRIQGQALSTSVPIYIAIKFKSASMGSSNNFTIKMLESDNINYWQLIDYFSQYNIQSEMLKTLQNLSINVHGDVIQQTETVINNYDTNFNTIHNIETNFTSNFDSTNSGVISLLNSNLQIPQGFVEGSNFIKVLFPKVVDNSSLVGFPYFLILAIVVMIVLLG